MVVAADLETFAALDIRTVAGCTDSSLRLKNDSTLR